MTSRAAALRPLVLLLVLAGSFGCSSTQPFDCASSPKRAPRNFGAVAPKESGTSPVVYRGGQPESCGEMEYLKSVGVKSILKLNDAGHAIDDAEKSQAAALGLKMKSFGFGAASIGESSTCSEVSEALAFLRDEANWPVYVHCTMGKDRTGYLIGMYEKHDLGRDTAEVLEHLREYGHKGSRAVAFAQISAELRKQVPACVAAASE